MQCDLTQCREESEASRNRNNEYNKKKRRQSSVESPPCVPPVHYVYSDEFSSTAYQRDIPHALGSIPQKESCPPEQR